MSELESVYIPHLRAQFAHGRPILFTGAGFSLDAKSISGGFLPSGKKFTRTLWDLCYPNDSFDESVTLQDLYGFALQRERKRLSELLTATFTVDENTLPKWYSRILSLPWQRVYTLNIDDLDEAAERKFSLPRQLESNSVKKAD